MKTAKKIWIKIALFLALLGFVIFLISLSMMRFDLTQLNTVDYVTNTHTVSEDFTDISILTTGCDINFKPATDGVCKVVCKEGERLFHTVKVNNNRLVIEENDNRRWYENVNISWGKISITVYLPDYSYNSLIISADSGDIEISRDFTFNSAEIITSSGYINLTAQVNKELKLGSNSGEIYVDTLTTKEVEISSTSGDITLENINCDNIELKSASAEISLNQVLVSDDMQIHTTSGDIELDRCDAETLYMQSNSGDIEGELLSDKVFDVTTTSGEVSVPSGTAGGKCRIVTTSGDIDIQIKADGQVD